VFAVKAPLVDWPIFERFGSNVELVVPFESQGF